MANLNGNTRKVLTGASLVFAGVLVVGFVVCAVFVLVPEKGSIERDIALKVVEVLEQREQKKTEESTHVRDRIKELETLQPGNFILYPNGDTTVFRRWLGIGGRMEVMQVYLCDGLQYPTREIKIVARGYTRIVRQDNPEWAKLAERCLSMPIPNPIP